MALAATTPGEHQVFNVGALPASVADIITVPARVTGRPILAEHRPAFRGEARELGADTTKIRTLLGWTPERTSLDDLIADQWATRTTP